jgi:hypothetical protein
MHHIGVEEIFDVHEFERKRNATGPLRIKDLYHAFVQHQLTEIRLDWDNLSRDKQYENGTLNSVPLVQLEPLTDYELKAHESLEDCREACRHDASCLQFRYRSGTCAISEGITHGRPTGLEGAQDRLTSGWDLERISAWTAHFSDCPTIEWPSIEDGHNG